MTLAQYKNRVKTLTEAGIDEVEAGEIAAAIGDVIEEDDDGNIVITHRGREIAIGPELLTIE